MFTLLLQFMNKLFTAFDRAEPGREADEAYLAQSSDIYDLERRIRALDERGRSPDEGIIFGLYPR